MLGVAPPSQRRRAPRDGGRRRRVDLPMSGDSDQDGPQAPDPRCIGGRPLDDLLDVFETGVCDDGTKKGLGDATEAVIIDQVAHPPPRGVPRLTAPAGRISTIFAPPPSPDAGALVLPPFPLPPVQSGHVLSIPLY